MDLRDGPIKKLFFRYLAAAFGSALIVAIYSIVDSAMVGHYCGPSGVAALATVAPVWNIIFSLGLLFGIGGAVLITELIIALPVLVLMGRSRRQIAQAWREAGPGGDPPW